MTADATTIIYQRVITMGHAIISLKPAIRLILAQSFARCFAANITCRLFRMSGIAAAGPVFQDINTRWALVMAMQDDDSSLRCAAVYYFIWDIAWRA